MSEVADSDWSRWWVKPPYRFEMGLHRGDGRFFENTLDAPKLLAERAHWLQSNPERYAAVLPEGEPLLAEAMEWAAALNPSGRLPAFRPDESALDRCHWLGKQWEPDFLLLRPDNAGFRLVAACVCFPSSWALAEKMGLPVDEIHGVVPRLNPELGSKIQAFLAAMRPGSDWERVNWGLAATPELNLHPARRLPRLNEEASLASTWFRLERQALRALPRSGGILFGLRIQVWPLCDLVSSSPAAQTFRQLLETMPEEIAEYKGLSAARPALIRGLAAVGSR